MLIKIDDPADARLDGYRDIRERDMVGRQGRFIAEGRVVLSVLMSVENFAVESLLISENRLAGIADLLERLADEIPVYIASLETLSTIAGFHVHRGVMAIGVQKTSCDFEITPKKVAENSLIVVLSDISNHDNMGSIFRNCAAFEADLVILDDKCCDPLYRKALRVSVGAVLKVPFIRSGAITAIVTGLEQQGYSLAALSAQGSKSISEMVPNGRRALLLGSEGHGLPQAVMEKCETWAIPMSRTFDSLNVATASGIALFHASQYSQK